MQNAQYEAWLTTDKTCLPGNGEVADVSIMDETRGSDLLQVLPVTPAHVAAHGGDVELAANAVLETAGWFVPGNDHGWSPVSTGGTRQVEWRHDEPVPRQI